MKIQKKRACSSVVERRPYKTDAEGSIPSMPNMKSVVICGSRRFKPEMRKFADELKKFGVIVFEPYLHQRKEDEWQKIPDGYKKFVSLGLTHDHFYKIKMADVVYVYNKGGYCGCSTTLEIGGAVVLGKPIYVFSEDEELARNSLFREIIKTPKDLVKRLQ